MPRLDVWLVENGYFSSRQTAKRAIKDGFVTVDNKPAKPSYNVKRGQDIKVLNDYLDHPKGYEKLKQLETFLFDFPAWKNSFVLDIGSSAGGFLRYLAEKGAKAIGIEVSNLFKDKLLRIANYFPNISVIIDDAFKIKLSTICQEKELDLLLIDVTTDTEGTLKLINRFRPLLKINGHLISAFKSKPEDVDMSKMKLKIKDLGFVNIHEIILNDALQEFHLFAIRA